MEFEKYESFDSNYLDGHSNFSRDLLEKYLHHYWWFVLSLISFSLVTFVYLRTTVPQFQISSSILIKSTEKGSSFAELSEFESLGLFGSGENILENEIQILKSRRLMLNVVKELHLNVSYFLEDSPYDQELFLNSPLKLDFESESGQINNINSEFELLFLSRAKIEIRNFSGTPKVYPIDDFFELNLGSEDAHNEQSIRISLNENFEDDLIGRRILIKISTIKAVANDLLSRIVIEPINSNNSNVLVVSIKDTNKDKGISVVGNIIEQYNADGINDNNFLAQTTTSFLDSRINLISQQLTVIESTAEQFRSKNRMVDSRVGTNYFMESSSLNEKELVTANTQLQLITYMLEELAKMEFGKLLPGNIGLNDAGIISLISEYNELVLKRNRILKSSSRQNPIVVGIDDQLQVLKLNLKGSLINLESTVKIEVQALNDQGGIINSRIATVPKNEREFKNIVREQETKNALYLFLLQKREESILSNAVNISKAKIIDPPFAFEAPVYPKRKLTYLMAIFLSVLAPVILIYLKEVLDTKIHSDKDFENLKIPFLGDIPLGEKKSMDFIRSANNSNIAEAFRYIRTNLGFMIDKDRKGKVLLVTSTKEGEGKSFVAINLANSLALSGKKTLLLGLDLRAPKISSYMKLENGLGVTNFVVNSDLNIESIVEKHTGISNLDLINSGDIPPNPVELIMNKRIDEIFDFARLNYEYVIVDTAPVGMVTDTIELSRFSDLTIYVIKANFLDKRMLHIPRRIRKEGKLKNMSILLNGTNSGNGNYGYGYGYGAKKKTTFLNRLINK